MAFSEKIKGTADAPLQCGICRQLIPDGRRILSEDYECDAPICKSCYQQYFMNSKQGLDIGITDDTDRSPVRYRRADPLEYDPVFRREEPPCGFEYPFPECLIEQTIRDTVFWVLFCIAVRLFLYLTGSPSYEGTLEDSSLSAQLLDLLIPAGSLIWAMRYLYQLVQGMLYGMGYLRQFVLLGAMIVQAVLAWLAAAGMIIW